MAYISSLKLHNFRCYVKLKIDGLESGLIVLFGPNGAGKTNVLEAVSLLTPGRGLRKAKMVEMQCKTTGESWAVAASVSGGGVENQIGTGLDARTEKRTVRINGETAKSQAALADYFSCLWLTPQMDGIFLGPSSERRSFLDRMIYASDPAHAGRVARYENAMRQRARLLSEGKDDRAWLEALEIQMAETGVAIAASRLEFVEKLQQACVEFQTPDFPHAALSVRGTIEELLPHSPALEVEEMFKYQLAQSRGVDMRTGGAASGPHKSDLLVRYAPKNMAADQCSTGEQKALLIGIVLAHAGLIKASMGAAPALLLDEVAAHLDEGRRAALYDLLLARGGQVWLTGTDKGLFSAVEGKAQFFEVKEGKIYSST